MLRQEGRQLGETTRAFRIQFVELSRCVMGIESRQAARNLDRHGRTLDMERWYGRRAGAFAAVIWQSARRFPCTFASRAGVPDQKCPFALTHEVSHASAGTGAGEPPGRTGGGQSVAIGRRQPFWHRGQRSDELVCGDRVTGKSMLTLGESASSRVRHNWILAVRPRLARKPKWRIFTKPRGST